MNDIEYRISFPLDDDGFFRRECPYCMREFKILITSDEIQNLSNKLINSFLLNSDNTYADSDMDEDNEENDALCCPYCGQEADHGNWWTQEQVAYIDVIGSNFVSRLINKELFNPLEKLARDCSSSSMKMQVSGGRFKEQKPWISPEENDMRLFPLPCCDKEIKIQEEWTSSIYCPFCGFEHSSK